MEANDGIKQQIIQHRCVRAEKLRSGEYDITVVLTELVQRNCTVDSIGHVNSYSTA